MLIVFERLVWGSPRHFWHAMLTGGRRGGILRPSELLVVAFCCWVYKSILILLGLGNKILYYNMGLLYQRILLYIPTNSF